ncbi:activating signal cointegrator 1 complex subunit 1-like [Clavelina lepadiformis]|uniref:activating signal cointegrator 1 complex subunit 1-like n=1 Tax=Clavelina lepadiformis TaxID=159417 RepID=UPI004043500C
MKMDILNPHLININGRIYCKYNVEKPAPVPDEFLHENNETSDAWWDDEPDCQEEENVTKNSKGLYETALQIPSSFFKYIIGNRGDMKKRLEHETKTKIQIPGKGQEGDVIITGNESCSVTSAKTRINLLVASKRWKQPFTHFISIPLTSESVKAGFQDFKNKVLQDFSKERGIDESIFQKPLKLHLTICTLVLLNESEINHAKEIFQKCQHEILSEMCNGVPLEISVEGLEYMNDDPGAVDVLYAKVQCLDDSERLQVIAKRIAETFAAAGLSEKQYDRVKLHGTLMNTIFRRNGKERDNRNRKSRESFNASPILLNLQDFKFGQATFHEVHLSQRLTTAQNGYYSCTDKITAL